jgi:hypothetical protein
MTICVFLERPYRANIIKSSSPEGVALGYYGLALSARPLLLLERQFSVIRGHFDFVARLEFAVQEAEG